MQDYEKRMGFPSVEDAIEDCVATAADADGGTCATKCRRECRDEAEGKDEYVRGVVEWEKFLCLSKCGV